MSLPSEHVGASSPYAAFRVRWLLLSCVVSMAVSQFLSRRIWGAHGAGVGHDSARAVASYVLDYGFGLAVIAFWMRQAGLTWRRLFGSMPSGANLARAGAMVFPLFGVTCVWVFGTLAALSFAFPDFVRALMLLGPDDARLPWYLNVTSSVVVVGLAPLVEEILFRGILFPRLSVKWGVKTGLVASSLVFGFCHVDVLGAFCFSGVAAVLTLRYRSLWPAVAMHVVNNAVSEIFGALGTGDSPMNPSTIIAELRSSWWIAVVGATIGVPWLWWFARRHPWAQVKEWARAYGIA